MPPWGLPALTIFTFPAGLHCGVRALTQLLCAVAQRQLAMMTEQTVACILMSRVVTKGSESAGSKAKDARDRRPRRRRSGHRAPLPRHRTRNHSDAVRG